MMMQSSSKPSIKPSQSLSTMSAHSSGGSGMQSQPSSASPSQSSSIMLPHISSIGMQHISSTIPSQSLSSPSQSSTVDGHTSSGLSAQNARWFPSWTSWNGIQN